MKIELLGTSILIKRGSAEKETAAGIFLGVRFRENFAEPLMIDGGEYLFFRELESSIYYYIYE